MLLPGVSVPRIFSKVSMMIRRACGLSSSAQYRTGPRSTSIDPRAGSPLAIEAPNPRDSYDLSSFGAPASRLKPPQSRPGTAQRGSGNLHGHESASVQ